MIIDKTLFDSMSKRAKEEPYEPFDGRVNNEVSGRIDICL